MNELLIIAVLGVVFFWQDKIHNPRPFSPIRQNKILASKSIVLSPEQYALFKILENSSGNLFITGKAGSGKTRLLKFFKDKSKKQLIVCAPTGVAALSIGGQTIHSLFNLKPGHMSTVDLADEAKAILFRRLECLVIDEASMLRADIVDAIDRYLRQVRNSPQAFGGVQLILFGDLYQLPPIVSDKHLDKYFKSHFGGIYFFNAKAWRIAKLMVYELQQVHRQKDDKLIEILNKIRDGTVNKALLNLLNKRVVKHYPKTPLITLTTTNEKASLINQQCLSKLPGKLYCFKAEETFGKGRGWPADTDLKLKCGAQVMMLNNDKNKRWVNGSLGKVESLSYKQILVRLNHNIYSVSPISWHKNSYVFDDQSKALVEE